MEKEVTLLEAVSLCYGHKKKKEEILFEIRFKDVTRTIKFGKHWNKVYPKWIYFIHETYGPCLSSDELDFLGNLANTKGVSFGGNVPPYKVYQLSCTKKEK